MDIFEDQPEFKEGALGPNSFEVMEDLIAAGELTPVVGTVGRRQQYSTYLTMAANDSW